MQEQINECQVCYCEFENNRITIDGCCHSMICNECFKHYLKSKITSNDVTPWLPCPAPDCSNPIGSELLIQNCDIKDLYHFSRIFLSKHLARSPHFFGCETKNCEFGWIWPANKEHKMEVTLKCDQCNKRQKICKDPLKNDKGFQDMIKNGMIRLCPKCKLPTMKDKGMCNIMHCAKCGIYWNWQTLETGNSTKELKNRARSNGTLWEPGELRYQQELQRSNLPEFIKLLERNGIKYDANYVRGTR